MTKFICILACISFLLWGTQRTLNGIDFEKKCQSYLQIVSNANSIELAKQRLAVAIKYCEDKKLTEGYTNIFYQTQDENIEAWYINLKASLANLDSIPPNADKLLVSNVLIKFQKSLTHTDSDKTIVTFPDGISIYPNNKLYFWWCTISVIIAIIAGFFWYKEYNS